MSGAGQSRPYHLLPLAAQLSGRRVDVYGDGEPLGG